MHFPSAFGRSLVLAGLTLLLGCASAHAATVYVAPGGADSRDCLTPATACETFDRGYHAASPGDVVEVAGGSYPYQWFTDDPAKTSEVDVLVRPAPGERVVVSCPDGPDNCLATDGADHLTVQGIEIAHLEPVFVEHLQRSMPQQGGVALDRGSVDVTFRDIDAGHLWLAADDAKVLGGDYGPTVDEDTKIAGGDGSNQLIDGAVFHDMWHDQLHMQCIWLAGANGVTIRNSRFDTCSTFAIFSTPEVGQHFRDVLIENNVFSNSGDVSMSTHVKVGSHGGDCTNFLIRNNTFVDENVMSDCGVEEGKATDIRWIGNIFTDWGTGGECDFGGAVFDYNVIEEGNACGAHDLLVGSGNAGFVNRAARDFRLRPDSPAIDRGSPTDFPAFDFDGNPRPSGAAPDAGAFELMPPARDDTPPTIELRMPALGGATYARGAIAFADFDCNDDSGFVTCAGTVADGTALDTTTVGPHDFTVTATDLAGNTATRTVTYTVVDRTNPTIALRAPAADGTYARGENVLADYDCTDETALGSCVGTVADNAPINTATLGAKTFTVTATDTAGNTATRTVSYTVADRTNPTIDVRAPPAGATYARGDSVLADYDCADETALGSCAGTVADGTALDTTTVGPHDFTVTATDLAGNTAARTVTYTVVDRTNPTIDVRAPAAGATYARGENVLADYDCADETALGSCVGTVADNAPINTATLGAKAFTVTATDTAGNTATRTVSYTVVDRTNPTIDVRAPPAGATYARGDSVLADYDCTDETALGSCAGTVADGAAIDTEALGAKTFTVTATDTADNTTTRTITYTVVDRTKPTINIRTPTPDGKYELGDRAVIVDFDCTDETGGSGVESCVGTAADGAALDTTALGPHELTVTAEDKAGNTASDTVEYTVEDRTKPTIELREPTGGATYARGATVLADYACADETGGSGLGSCVGTVADDAPIDTAKLGAREFTVTATDTAGNTATRTTTYTVADRGDPSIELRAPREGATYVRGASVAAVYWCADDGGGSGLAWCRGTVAAGAPIDTAALGVHRFTVSAGDEHGNTTSRTAVYRVVAPPRPPAGEPLPVRRYRPADWNRTPGSPRASLGFRLPTRAELLGVDGLAVSIDCRRRCRAAVVMTVRAGAERVRVRAERGRLSSSRRTLRLRLTAAQRERLLDAGPLDVRLNASVRDARGRRARLSVARFGAPG